MNRNYQKELEKKIEEQERQGWTPRLFLHSCCAPCSSYVLEYLSQYYEITVFYYNPNIYPDEEYWKRVEEQKAFVQRFSKRQGQFAHSCGESGQCGVKGLERGRDSHPIRFLEGKYDKERFYQMAKGLEDIPEGGERCFQCYELRLREAAQCARELHMDYFTTTLSISPRKNAAKLNEIGEKLAEEYGVAYLPSDFKKKDGYKRSVELSKEYGMYRQDYCGCVFSMQERKQAASKQR